MLQRDFKLTVKCLVSATIWILLLSCICTFVAGILIQSSGDAYKKAKVIVADREDTLISRILIHTVSELEAISEVLEVESMDYEDAMHEFTEGNCAAVVELPEGYLQAITSGKEAKGRIYLSSAIASHAEIIQSIAAFGEQILVAGQYGVFSGELLLRDIQAKHDIRQKFLTKSNTELLNEAMKSCERYFQVEVLDYHNTSMSTVLFYYVCWICFILYMASLFFVSLTKTDCTRSMLCRLKTCGVGFVRFISSKVLCLSVFRFLLLILSLLILKNQLEAEITIWTVICSIEAVVFITVTGMCITMCTEDSLTGNILFAVGGLLFCGGLVPRQLLPELVVLIGEYSPFGIAKSLLAQIAQGSMDWSILLPAFLYSIVSVVLIIRKINRTMAGRT